MNLIGCSFENRGESLKTHESTCTYNNIHCPVPICDELRPEAGIYNHMIESHFSNGYYLEDKGLFFIRFMPILSC